MICNISRTVNHLIGSNFAKQIVRCNYHNRNFGRKKKAVDPGIQNRKALLDDEKELEELDDYDFDMESDFMNVADTHKQFELEKRFQHEREKYLIVGRKYFKENAPNFLTWNDKEQIRYLHNTNPEEWTIEKLSDSFPAVPDVIAKVIKSRWTKKAGTIRNHDESVKQNWSLFKEGKCEHLPSDLVDHLKKFTNRSLNFKSFEAPDKMRDRTTKAIVSNRRMGTEFSEIITSYERLKNKNQDDDKKLNTYIKPSKPPKEDTYLLNGYQAGQYNKHTTLNNFQRQIQKKAQDGDEKVMLKENQNIEEKLMPVLEQKEVNTLVENRYARSTEISTSVIDSSKQLNLLDYPEKITIPKSKFKKGYTYKLNDCYYDDDGEFLYRVPGMY